MILARWAEERRQLAIAQALQSDRIQRALAAARAEAEAAAVASGSAAGDLASTSVFSEAPTPVVDVAAPASVPVAAIVQATLAPGETLITEADFAALGATAITSAELGELAAIGRGHYVLGDTRDFVQAQEQSCLAYNCWMTRDPDRSARLVSEPPLAPIA